MAAVPALITVEQLYQKEFDGQPYELQAGTIVRLTVPASKHVKLQRRLRQLLEAKLTGWGPVETEMPYRALPQFEYRRADVAATLQSRWDAIDPDDNLRGAPELAVEVKSPSNTKRQLRELASLCLANGCRAFWIIDDEKQTVTVVGLDGASTLYELGDSVPLTVVDDRLPVQDIFA